MSENRLLKKKLDDLITLMLTDGVQPNELVNNIFLDDYTSITYRKANNQIIGELTFIQENLMDITLRYIYSAERKILSIEEEILGEIKIVWNRNYKEDQLINEIVDILKVHYTHEQMDKFLSTLPSNLISKIKQKYKVA